MTPNNEIIKIHLFPQLYDPNTGDYSTQSEYMYETYDGYDEDSSGNSVMQQQGTPPITEPGMVGQGDESPPPIPKSKKPKVSNGNIVCFISKLTVDVYIYIFFFLSCVMYILYGSTEKIF